MLPVHPRILAAFMVIAYAVTSSGPRGSALCLGGGHAISEIVAAACSGDEHGHSHAGHVAEASACQYATDHDCACVACQHHRDHQSPCTDIPLGAQDARLRIVDESTNAQSPAATACSAAALPPWIDRHTAPPLHLRWRIPIGVRDADPYQQLLCAHLQGVILNT